MRSPASLLVLLVAWIVVAGPAAASPIPDLPPPLLTIQLTSGDTIRAIWVEPASIDVIRITDSKWEVGFFPTNRVRRVVDDSGVDRTRDALERRQVVGRRPVKVDPVKPRRSAPSPALRA